MDAYSIDLRVRVLADVDAGMGTVAAARKYRVSSSWVQKLRRRQRETGEIAARKARVSHATKLDAHLELLEQLVAERPDATLLELRDALGAPVAPATVWRALKRLQLTFKKK